MITEKVAKVANEEIVENKLNFGDLLRKYRKELTLTQRQLYDEIEDYGCDYREKHGASLISRWETGHRNPPKETVRALEHILNVPDNLLVRAAGYDAPNRAVENQFKVLKGTITTSVGQGKLLNIELPTQRVILHQLKVWGSKPSQYRIQVCESTTDYFEAEYSTIYNALRPERGIDMFCRLPDIYYEDNDGGNSLHLEITPLLSPWDKLGEEITYTITVWLTPQ